MLLLLLLLLFDCPQSDWFCESLQYLVGLVVKSDASAGVRIRIGSIRVFGVASVQAAAVTIVRKDAFNELFVRSEAMLFQ